MVPSLIICFYTIIWFHVFLSNTNNFQKDLFDPYVWLEQVLPFWVSVNQGVIVIKGYSILNKDPELGLVLYSEHLFIGGGGTPSARDVVNIF